MNREIKFRAWDEGSEIMLYPESNTSGEYIWEFSGSDCKIRILAEQEYHTIEGGEDTVRVDWLPIKCKLMQCTGLKDKNVVEIYEGDIVRLGDVECPITWEDGGFQMITDSQQGRSAAMQDRLKRFEVIGNIYQNPELA